MSTVEPLPPVALPGPAPGRTCRVLALDDQPEALRLLEIRLRAAGFECLSFSQPTAALEFLRKETVDLVILDVMMPQLDGFEVCRRLKQDPRTRDVPVIFLTAKVDMEDRVRALEVGAHDYLNKPVEPQELLARTRAALRTKLLQDQLRAQLEVQAELHQLQHEKLSDHWEKTLGQLAASLAHEINNPLAVALGSIQLLEMQHSLPKEVIERLQVIDDSLQRAAQKLRSLLLIAQLSRSTEAVLLSRLIEDLLALVNYDLVVNKVKLVSELDPNCAWIGSPGELARALLYLFNNAIEAVQNCPEASIYVGLKHEGDEYQISVADNGAGIPEDIRSKVFDAFFTSKGQPHHGIGLYLASEIIGSMGGEIGLRAESGHGRTEFLVHLPGWG